MLLDDTELVDSIIEILKPSLPVDPLEWVESNVYIPSGPYKGYYDTELFPFWREIIRDILDPDIEELVICKSSQAGATALMIALLCFLMSVDPASCAYVGPSTELSQDLRIERIEPVLKACKALKEYYRDAEAKEAGSRKKGSGLYLSNGSSLNVLNSGSTGDSKSRSIKYLFCDELDAWSSNTLDKFRSRLTHYKGLGGKLICISAPDVSAKKTKQKSGKTISPIFAEINKTDKREYFLTDPITKESFSLKWTGLKWSKEAKDKETGEYNYKTIRDTVYYKSPKGKEYTQREIKELLLDAKWKATQKGRDEKKRGYLINALYYREWGDMAIEFLEANKGGFLKLKTWVAEQLGEELFDEKREATDNLLSNLEQAYKRGESFFTPDQKTKRILTVDIQKYELYYLITDVLNNGDISIITWGTCKYFSELEEIRKSNKCVRVFMDVNYFLRRAEALKACAKYGYTPCIGQAKNRYPLRKKDVDPLEGTPQQGKYLIPLLEHNTDISKHEIYDRYNEVSSNKLYIYRKPERKLIEQLTAEKYIDGEWVNEGKNKDNHLFDTLILVLVYINSSLGKKIL